MIRILSYNLNIVQLEIQSDGEEGEAEEEDEPISSEMLEEFNNGILSAMGADRQGIMHSLGMSINQSMFSCTHPP